MIVRACLKLEDTREKARLLYEREWNGNVGLNIRLSNLYAYDLKKLLINDHMIFLWLIFVFGFPGCFLCLPC